MCLQHCILGSCVTLCAGCFHSEIQTAKSRGDGFREVSCRIHSVRFHKRANLMLGGEFSVAGGAVSGHIYIVSVFLRVLRVSVHFCLFLGVSMCFIASLVLLVCFCVVSKQLKVRGAVFRDFPGGVGRHRCTLLFFCSCCPLLSQLSLCIMCEFLCFVTFLCIFGVVCTFLIFLHRNPESPLT